MLGLARFCVIKNEFFGVLFISVELRLTGLSDNMSYTQPSLVATKIWLVTGRSDGRENQKKTKTKGKRTKKIKAKKTKTKAKTKTKRQRQKDKDKKTKTKRQKDKKTKREQRQKDENTKPLISTN